MSTTIKVPLSVLQDYARKLQDFADQNEDIFDRINNSLLSREASGEWKDRAVTAAVNATAKNKQKHQEAVADLRRLADFLSGYCAQMAAKDAELKNRVGRA